MSAIAPDLLEQLEIGTLETATLTECLAINMRKLMHAAFPNLPSDQIDPALGVVQRMSQAGCILRAGLSETVLNKAVCHPSDTVRGWVAFALGQDIRIPSMQRLSTMRIFAADPHFGVREWAWMAVRAIVVAETEAAIAQLVSWVSDPDPNIRRFASEATRPRGVWAASIPLLRQNPEVGLAILTPLRFDAARYVEDSVANWLNDAGKDRPDWLRSLLDEWQDDGVSTRLITRAGRSLKMLE
jgi:3-methyladenine DNA glycosylase AlkC